MVIRRILLCISLVGGSIGQALGMMPAHNQADGLPLYSTVAPHTLLTTAFKNEFREEASDECGERFQLSVSPFYQYANSGSNLTQKTTTVSNLAGNWNMLGLFYDAATQNLLDDAL